jgi:L,D-peptidoglycan transpeptidase YkuD (ErfK/YbiS/YcfS/YnhG family)
MRFLRLAISGYALATAFGACSQATGTRSGPATSTSPTLAPVQSPLDRALQLVVFTAPDWSTTTGMLHRFERPDSRSAWTVVASAIPAVIGRTGLAWSDPSLASDMHQPVKQEGDGKSPAGAFPLDTAFGFAPIAEMSWVRMPYANLVAGSDCVDDETSVHYNTVVDRSSVPKIDWTSAEHMRSIGQYRIGVIVGYNAAPATPGRGSCIFLHIWGGPSSTTAGCTAMDAGRLEALMRWLDASRHPALVQLPAAEYERLRGTWKLPVL